MENTIVTEKPTVPAYPGMRWIYHRLTYGTEYMFDFRPIRFEAGEYKQMPELQAVWMFEHHAKRESPSRYDDPDPAVRAEAVEYAFALDDDPHFGVPLVLGENAEYLSRDGQAMYLQRGTDVKTHPQLIKVGEVSTELAPAREGGNGTAHPSADVLALATQIAKQMVEAQQNQRRITGRKRPKRAHPVKAAGGLTRETPAGVGAD